jgi:uncharacterized membrane protein YqaE (UPF0057 family)
MPISVGPQNDLPDSDEAYLYPRWKPFPPEAYQLTCSICPKRGFEEIPNRAAIRAMVICRTRDGQPSLFARLPLFVVYNVAVVLETCFAFWEGPGRGFMRKLGLWAITLLILFGPAYYFLRNPGQQLPGTTQFLLDILLFLMAYLTSHITTIESADRNANQKWIPQSRQACRGLLTVWADVQSFRQELAEMCGMITREITEMQSQKMQGARAVLGSQCSAGAQRLDVIANHLSDAVAAWETFIGANCEGAECALISQELDDRRTELRAQLAAQRSVQSCAEAVPSNQGDLNP